MKRKKINKNSVKFKTFILYLMLIILFAVSLCFTTLFEGIFNLYQRASYGEKLTPNSLKVYYANVGQGDLSLIVTPEDTTILIDSSTNNESKLVKSFLTETLLNNSISKIDYVIATHSDEDHIGNFAWIFETFQINNVYLPKISYEKNGLKLDIVGDEFNNFSQKVSTSVFKEFLTAVFTEPNCNITTYTRNEILDLDGTLDGINNSEVEFKFISENLENESSINNFSPVMKLTYNDKKLLWTGDGNSVIENRILNSVVMKNEVTDIDVYKAGHHGSNSSSSKKFLEAMMPKMVIVSCSSTNSYGHPGAEFLKRCEMLSVSPQILKTYENGNILIYVNSNGLIGISVDKEYTSHLRWYMIVITAEFFLIILAAREFVCSIRNKKIKKL